MGNQEERTCGKVAAGRLREVAASGLGSPHLCADKPGGTTGEPDRPHDPGFQCGEIKPQNL